MILTIEPEILLLLSFLVFIIPVLANPVTYHLYKLRNDKYSDRKMATLKELGNTAKEKPVAALQTRSIEWKYLLSLLLYIFGFGWLITGFFFYDGVENRFVNFIFGVGAFFLAGNIERNKFQYTYLNRFRQDKPRQSDRIERKSIPTQKVSPQSYPKPDRPHSYNTYLGRIPAGSGLTLLDHFQVSLPVKSINYEYSTTKRVVNGTMVFSQDRMEMRPDMKLRNLEKRDSRSFTDIVQASRYIYQAIIDNPGTQFNYLLGDLNVVFEGDIEINMMIHMNERSLNETTPETIIGNYIMMELLRFFHTNLENKQKMCPDEFIKAFIKNVYGFESTHDPRIDSYFQEYYFIFSDLAQKFYGQVIYEVPIPEQYNDDSMQSLDSVTFENGVTISLGDRIKVKKKSWAFHFSYFLEGKVLDIYQHRRLFRVKIKDGITVFPFKDIVF